MRGYAKFFNLYDFESEKDINELLTIINLFDLESIPLKSSVTIEKDSEFLNLRSNKNFNLEVLKTGKRPFNKKEYHEIKLTFLGIMLASVIKLAAKEGVALCISSYWGNMTTMRGVIMF